MQDVHWAAGLIGYFPSYAIGNLIAGQLWERVQRRHHRPRRPARSATSWSRCVSGCASMCTAMARATATMIC